VQHAQLLGHDGKLHAELGRGYGEVPAVNVIDNHREEQKNEGVALQAAERLALNHATRGHFVTA